MRRSLSCSSAPGANSDAALLQLAPGALLVGGGLLIGSVLVRRFVW
jgi:hypothetical protein